MANSPISGFDSKRVEEVLDDIRRGSSCWAVRYAMTAEPIIVHACQRMSGSAFVLNTLVEQENLKLLSGEPVAFNMVAATGMPHDTYFTQTCGTYVWSLYRQAGGTALFPQRSSQAPDRGKTPGLPAFIFGAEFRNLNALHAA